MNSQRALLNSGLLLLASAGVCSGQVSDANKPYVPTRLEWMELYLNAGKSVPYSEDKGFGISYVSDEKSETLYMVVIVNQQKVNGKALENALASSRRLVDAYAKRKGWDEWLKFEERLQTIGPTSVGSDTNKVPTEDEPSEPLP